ncbi:MAG: 50S ribosomal protein L32 [Candidatus Omnitrophica bacterium]|nr:50S ribosomal protein L32 [Candidatus Omnitrophota bacterium]
MANPKRRHSNMRTRLRRTHDTLKLASMSTCQHCGASILPHRICTHCGHYKGKQTVTIKQKSENKQ